MNTGAGTRDVQLPPAARRGQGGGHRRVPPRRKRAAGAAGPALRVEGGPRPGGRHDGVGQGRRRRVLVGRAGVRGAPTPGAGTGRGARACLVCQHRGRVRRDGALRAERGAGVGAGPARGPAAERNDFPADCPGVRLAGPGERSGRPLGGLLERARRPAGRGTAGQERPGPAVPRGRTGGRHHLSPGRDDGRGAAVGALLPPPEGGTAGARAQGAGPGRDVRRHPGRGKRTPPGQLHRLRRAVLQPQAPDLDGLSPGAVDAGGPAAVRGGTRPAAQSAVRAGLRAHRLLAVPDDVEQPDQPAPADAAPGPSAAPSRLDAEVGRGGGRTAAAGRPAGAAGRRAAEGVGGVERVYEMRPCWFDGLR